MNLPGSILALIVKIPETRLHAGSNSKKPDADAQFIQVEEEMSLLKGKVAVITGLSSLHLNVCLYFRN